MSTQSSCSKILFALKHHLSEGLPLVFGQCSNGGKNILHQVDFLGFLFLLPLSVFFSWAISCPMSCLPAFEAFSLLHQCLSLLKCQGINVHHVWVFLFCWSVPASAHRLVVISLVLAKNGCRFSVICIELNCLLKPVIDCLWNYFAKHNLMGERII